MAVAQTPPMTHDRTNHHRSSNDRCLRKGATVSYYPGFWFMDDADAAPPDRCDGTEAHGCGRFLRIGAWSCDRCERELRDAANAQAAQDAADAANATARLTTLGAWTPLVADPRDLPF